MTRPVRVLLLALGDVPTGQMPGSVQLHRCADLADAIGRAAAGAADALLVSPGVAGLDAMVVARLRTAGCRVLALTDGSSDEGLAARIGIGQCIGLPLRPDGLVAAISAVGPDQEAADRCDPVPALGAPIVAVWGPPGSPGRTTITSLLAAGARREGLQVGVVDADLTSPIWSLAGQDPVARSGLLVAARRAATGAHDVSDLLTEVAPGIRALLMTAEPLRWTEVAPQAMPAILRSVAAQVDLVLVDVGCDIRPAHPAYDIGWAHDAGAVARATLAAADSVVAVLACDPVGVHRFASWWQVLRTCVEPAAVVANKVGMPGAGRRPQRQVADVLDALEFRAQRAFVPWRQPTAEAIFGPGWFQATGWGDTSTQLWKALAPTVRPLPVAA